MQEAGNWERLSVSSALLTVTIVIALGAVTAAQRAQFDVASVKPHTSNDQREYMLAQPGGRFVAANITVRSLIRTAFQLQDYQIVGGPDWLGSDRFDIEARSPETQGPPTARLLEMLQALLADRFSLTTHTEKRALPV